MTLAIAKPNTAYGSGLGKTRWGVERTLAWLHRLRRLRTRYDRRRDIHGIRMFEDLLELIELGFVRPLQVTACDH